MKEISIQEFQHVGIGQVENAAAGTGCTVFVSRDGMRAGLDVRGGGPASRESQLLNPLMAAREIHAIVLAGGSAFGLGAADGVMRLLEERGSADELCRLVVMNTASIQLFPATVAALRSAAGSAAPLDLLPAVWVASALALTAGLLAERLLRR